MSGLDVVTKGFDVFIGFAFRVCYSGGPGKDTVISIGTVHVRSLNIKNFPNTFELKSVHVRKDGVGELDGF